MIYIVADSQCVYFRIFHDGGDGGDGGCRFGD